MKYQYDLMIIGGGPAGYVAGIRAAQLGMSVAVMEQEHLGGTCLNVGCIPTKTLFQSAEVADTVRDSTKYGIGSQLTAVDFAAVMKRKDQVVSKLVGGVGHLLKKHKVEVISGKAKIVSSKKVINTVTGDAFTVKNILVATGSSNAVPPIPGMDGKNVIDSTALLHMTTMPESMVVIGGGVIGCEFASILNSLGCKVTVIEMLPRLLGPMEESLADAVSKEFSENKIGVMTSAKVKSVTDKDGAKLVTYEKDGKEGTVSAQYVLVSTGRKANSRELGCENLGIQLDRGFIKVNEKMETNIPDIYAAGDITGQGMLAHTAFEGGTIAVENMAGMNRTMDYRAIPKVVFVKNEISSVGITTKDAKEAGYEVLEGNFNLAGNGKSLAMGKNKGSIKVIAGKENHEILGVHMVGPCASELVTVGTQLIASEQLLENVAETIYPHPAVSEALREACLDALGRAIHA